MATCPHGMPSPASCMDCQYEGNMPDPPKIVRTVSMFPFKARFDGTCRGCRLPVRVGDDVVRVGESIDGRDEDVWYPHVGCAPERTT